MTARARLLIVVTDLAMPFWQSTAMSMTSARTGQSPICADLMFTEEMTSLMPLATAVRSTARFGRLTFPA
jgi:hypothetical protein